MHPDLVPEELRPLYLHISLACYLLVFLNLFLIVPVTWVYWDRMSRMCSELVIRKVVVVTPSSTDPLGVRRGELVGAFQKKSVTSGFYGPFIAANITFEISVNLSLLCSNLA